MSALLTRYRSAALPALLALFLHLAVIAGLWLWSNARQIAAEPSNAVATVAQHRQSQNAPVIPAHLILDQLAPADKEFVDIKHQPESDSALNPAADEDYQAAAAAASSPLDSLGQEMPGQPIQEPESSAPPEASAATAGDIQRSLVSQQQDIKQQQRMKTEQQSKPPKFSTTVVGTGRQQPSTNQQPSKRSVKPSVVPIKRPAAPVEQSTQFSAGVRSSSGPEASDSAGQAVSVHNSAVLGGAASSPTAQSTTAGAGEQRLAYQQLVRQRLLQLQRYPNTARRRQQQGAPELAFSVLADGRMQAARLLSSSGYQSIDNAALSLLAKANPLPEPPAALRAKPVEFTITLVYRLD